MRKFWSTLSMLYSLGMARTFGEYQYSSGGPNQPDFAVYYWHGKYWWFPTGGFV